MPNISGQTLDSVYIDSIYFKGKVTVINFSRNYCLPCVFEYKNLNEIYEYFGNDKINVLGIYLLNRGEMQ
jgi:hypothetical protein